MKPHVAWFELSMVAAGLMAVMLVMMWAQGPGGSCTLSLEASRVLVLSRETDREHLATDRASAARIARLAGVDPSDAALVGIRPGTVVWWRGWSSGTVSPN